MNQPNQGPHGVPEGYRVSTPPQVPVTPIFQQPPQPQYAPQPQPQQAPPPVDQPSWAGYAQPIGDIRDGHNPFLHDRDWEGQVAAARRGPMAWAFLAFFLGLGVFYIGGLALSPVLRHAMTDFDGTTGNPPPAGPLLIVAFIPNLAFAFFPLLFSWWKGHGPKIDFGIAMRWRDLGIGIACGGIAIGLGYLVDIVLFRFFTGTEPSGGVSALGVGDGRTIWLALFALFAFIGAPITEELLFRGALWGALESFKINRYVVLVLVTLVFAYAHQEPQVTLGLFCQGLAIGSARMITGRISSSMVAHATNNLLPALILFLSH
ncbi:MAG TPA: type II CAAX endopeptidase family protein [Pseudonocardiaceae bacterium]